ncbi:SAM-dependent methyltransferase DSY4148 (UbiE paralog) [hydrothermal vent metagenome]|uniref:Arsenite methyltransferase n=1 Tax=hydrothermal vent metagenome TaxID=652676 RepID=A0A3B0TIQ7_9ZZZZ
MAGIDTRDEVRQRYAEAAASVEEVSGSTDCCSTSDTTAFDTADSGDFGTWLYEAGELAEIPDGAALAALGCGNPTAVADLHPGETVLDLGSGAGIDVLLSARRVGPDGFVYGIDMTDEMLALARKHQEETGATNVEFRKGVIEDIPLDDASVDVVISNCVVNLSSDKPAVLSETFRVLRPGGRIGIADVVSNDDLSEADRLERGSWVGCVAGALTFTEYHSGLTAAGFTNITIEPTHTVADGMHSAIIKATKPPA